MEVAESFEVGKPSSEGVLVSESPLFPSCKGYKEPQRRESRNQGSRHSLEPPPPTGLPVCSQAKHLPYVGLNVPLDCSGHMSSDPDTLRG